jgi:4-hydroxy-4-methyl-2-oxoglutarate aldolase
MESNESWLKFGSANVSDALRECGRMFQAMDGGIRPLMSAMKLTGPAFTVRCFPGATWALEQALELAKPGDVLVVDGAGASDVILMGGLMSTRAKSRLLAGAVLDAAVRDVEDIIALEFPVFSRHICPRGGTFAEIGEWQTTICCGRLPVQPGDWIVADRDGVVAVPADLKQQVYDAAARIFRREHRMERHLHEGKNLAESAIASTSPGNGNTAVGTEKIRQRG